MYIKEIKKKNTPNGKVFKQYQLAETYRIGKKVKQNLILYLSYNKLLENKQKQEIIDEKMFKVNQELFEIYRTLKMSSMPFVARKFVVSH